MDMITQTQHQIAELLASLEKETGQFVEAIEIQSVEVTGMLDVRKMLSRSVVITLKPIPGSRWETK